VREKKEEQKLAEALYSTYKDRKYIGDFTAKQLYDKIGITQNTLYSYANNDYTYRKSYTFRRRHKPEENLRKLTTEELCAEWDRVRKRLNPDAVENERNWEEEY
jgi:hypothetical protein